MMASAIQAQFIFIFLKSKQKLFFQNTAAM
jgi:hypothetical protein